MIIGILISGCSIIRNSKTTHTRVNRVTENIIESVKNQNITNASFFIQKAEIELSNEEGKQKFIATIKFEYPDKYLISIKGRTGIEGARIYITPDTLFANDRINKRLYSGTSLYLSRKFGLTQSFLPLILGDIVLDKTCEDIKEKCSGENLNKNCVVKGVMLNYNIDCKRGKIISASQINNFEKQGITIRYEGFISIGDFLIPKKIKFENPEYMTEINIRILKIEIPWSGKVNFVPGKGYELIELL